MKLGRFALALVVSCGSATSSSGDAGVDAARDATAPRPPQGGSVSIVATAYTLQEKLYASTLVSARFRGPRSPACTTVTAGDCTTTTCPPAPEPAYVDAGPLTLTGLVDGTVTLQYQNGIYGPISSAVQRFVGGETLEVKLAGSTIPAFGRKVTAPSFVTLVSPAWPPGAPLTVARSGDFTAKWDGGSAGVAFVRIDDGTNTLICDRAASAGSLTVPASALAPMAQAATFTFGTQSRDLADAGSFAADFVVTAVASRGGAAATGPASIE